jgi:prepilin-type N-terminal cleavage/methylation domain-containing protein/prepilin-type processing-associated H-X9-DG protein
MIRSGFTMMELIVAIVLIALFLFFCLAATVNLDNNRNRIRCASNLRQIGQAILLYSNDTKGSYPRTKYDASQADRPTAYTGVDSNDPFSPACPQVNDVSAALFLLLRTEDVTSAVFICPATGLKPDDYGGGTHTALDNANFPSGKTLSYSYADPYPSQAAAAKGYRLRQGLDPTFVVVADMNPGTPALTQLTLQSTRAEMRNGNSNNHSGNGQNVLYADGHVEFQNNPFCGMGRDNIYTYGASGSQANGGGGTGTVGSPVDVNDSVLLPTAIMATAPPASTAAATDNAPVAAAPIAPVDQGTDLTTYAVISAAAFLLILLGALAAVFLRKKKSARDVI